MSQEQDEHDSGTLYDVVVVGLGTIGSMALWKLAEAGLKVAGVEQFGVGHAHGAFAGESRLFRTAAHENPVYTPMLLRARELWQELEKATGTKLLLPTGVLSVAEGDSEALANIRGAIKDHGLPHKILTAEELAERYPQHRITHSTVGVLDELAGALRPEAAVLAATRQARSEGAVVYPGKRVTGIHVRSQEVVVQAEDEVIRSLQVVVSAGPWGPTLNPELQTKVEIYPLILTWFLPEKWEDFSPSCFPAFIRDTADIHLFGAPSVDGYTVKISASRVLGPSPDVNGLPRELSPPIASLIGEQVTRLFNGLSPEPVRYSIHPEGFTANKVPILDTSEDGKIITLTGFSGHGFKFAPVVGEIAVNLVKTGKVGYPDIGFSVADHPSIPPQDA